jgi:hypothetical protein
MSGNVLICCKNEEKTASFFLFYAGFGFQNVETIEAIETYFA